MVNRRIASFDDDFLMGHLRQSPGDAEPRFDVEVGAEDVEEQDFFPKNNEFPRLETEKWSAVETA